MTTAAIQAKGTIVDHKAYQMGVAPYKWVGMWSQPGKSMLESNPAGYNTAMSARPECCQFSCDHCGMGIMHHCMISDATGKRFSVGTSCIEKLHQSELTTQANKHEKDRLRLVRQAKADIKRETENAAREAVLEAQMVKNGGLNDYDFNRAAQLAFTADCADHNKLIAMEFLTALELAGGDFCDGIIGSILRGNKPTGYAGSVVCEIAAKQHGRKNSKAYNAVIEDYKAIWAKLELRCGTDYPAHLCW